MEYVPGEIIYEFLVNFNWEDLVSLRSVSQLWKETINIIITRKYLEQLSRSTIQKIIKCGDFDLINTFYPRLDWNTQQFVIICCIRYYQHQFLQYQNIKPSDYILSYAIHYGNIAYLSQIESNTIPTKICSMAAYSGQLELLKWALVKGYKLHHLVLPRTNIIAMIQYQLELGLFLTTNIFTEAAYEGNIDVLTFLLDNKCPYDAEACAAAARGDQYDTLLWLRNHQMPWDEETCRNVVIHGSMRMMQYVTSHHCQIPKNICDSAAARTYNGYQKLYGVYVPTQQIVTNWFRNKYYSLSEKTMLNAIKSGNILFVQWLKHNRCPLGVKCIYQAIKYNAISILKYLLVYIDVKLLDYKKISQCMVKSGKIEIIEYLYQKGYLCNHYEPMKIIFKKGHQCVLEWIMINTPPNDREINWNQCLQYALNHYHDDLVSFLIKNKRKYLDLKTIDLTFCSKYEQTKSLIDESSMISYKNNNEIISMIGIAINN